MGRRRRKKRRKSFRTQPSNNVLCFMFYNALSILRLNYTQNMNPTPYITCIWMSIYSTIQHRKGKLFFFSVCRTQLWINRKPNTALSSSYAIVWMPPYIHLCHRKINLIFAYKWHHAENLTDFPSHFYMYNVQEHLSIQLFVDLSKS